MKLAAGRHQYQRERTAMNGQTPTLSRLGAHWLIVLAFLATLSAPLSVAGDSPVKTVSVEGTFEEVRDALKLAIENKGINIAHTLAAAEMLNATGKDFGIEKNVYLKAEIVEFCSAKISHQLAQASPENIVLCPFTVGVYVRTDDPERVYLTYRRPFVLEAEASQAAVDAMIELIDSVITEATEW